jgi:hypothetical protein
VVYAALQHKMGCDRKWLVNDAPLAVLADLSAPWTPRMDDDVIRALIPSTARADGTAGHE